MEARSIQSPEDISSRVERGEDRALGRLISGLEDGDDWAGESLRLLRSRNASIAQVIGVTGPPGAGKSTLADKLIAAYRGRGEKVGVVAVDPSSPFSGGALLGDRIRMQSGALCDTTSKVFIRSLASRGRLGGLSSATAGAARALEAAGYGIVIVETVGIGQSEVDIARLADTVVLVSMPGSGDDIQIGKAGVMEIGDVFVVNKADREGADRLVREIREMLETGAVLRGQDLVPPALKTNAATGEGVAELVSALDERWARLTCSGELERRRLEGAVAETRELLALRLKEKLASLEGGLEEKLALRVGRGELSVAEAADILYASIVKEGGRR
jgi:LAO/AO transport system ATPase